MRNIKQVQVLHQEIIKLQQLKWQYKKIELDMRQIDKKDILNINREIIINKSLIHQYKNRLYDFQFVDNKIFLFQEFQPKGDLFQYMKNHRLSSLQKAIQFLHSKNIIHRDLKPENILLDSKLNPKICDFGWAVIDGCQRNTFCGTGEYMAPEIFKGNIHTFAVDIWSLGILLYEFLEGVTPFYGTTIIQIFENIKDKKISFKKCTDVHAIDLIVKILKLDPKKRITLDQILQSQYIKKILRQQSLKRKITDKNKYLNVKDKSKAKLNLAFLKEQSQIKRLLAIGNVNKSCQKLNQEDSQEVETPQKISNKTAKKFFKTNSQQKVSLSKKAIQKSQSGTTLAKSPRKITLKKKELTLKDRKDTIKMSREVECEYNMRQELSPILKRRKFSKVEQNPIFISVGSFKSVSKKNLNNSGYNLQIDKSNSPVPQKNLLAVNHRFGLSKSQNFDDSIDDPYGQQINQFIRIFFVLYIIQNYNFLGIQLVIFSNQFLSTVKQQQQ